MERNPTPLLHHQGAGVVAGGETQAFFEKYDTSRRPIAVTSKLRQYLDRRGHQIHEEHSKQQMTSWDLLYYLLRANFDGLRSGYCDTLPPQVGEGEGTYEYGHLVENVKDLGDQVEVQYETKEGHVETARADLVIGADGPSSTIRKLLLPQVKREYTGYVAWRGTVPENRVSQRTYSSLVEKFTFYHAEATQILSYVIPGENGTLETGRRLINWVWYCNYPEDSPEFHDLMTDSQGKTHHVTLPIGKMRPEILKKQQEHAKETLPPQLAELVIHTEEPFIQAITDVISPENVFFGGKLLLVGDAVAGFRPHTAASTSQAAFDAQKLAEWLSGEMDLGQWEQETMQYASFVQKRGVELGERSQFGRHPLGQGRQM